MSSLCVAMIVRDAAELLPACLISVRDVAQEIVIADTGSNDATIDIAKQYGARVLQVPWMNDFSEPRNLVLKEARCEWILCVDADEQLDPTAWLRLPELLKAEGLCGYRVTIRNYLAKESERIRDQEMKANDSLLPASCAYPVFCEQTTVRLFRRDPRIYFTGKVNESVVPRVNSMRGTLGDADFCLHHFGHVADTATKAKRNQLYREIGQQRLRETPGDWRAHVELGLLELDQFRNLIEAQRLFVKAVDLNPSEGSIWFLLGLTHFRMASFEDALKALRKAENCGYRNAATAETRGEAQYNLGRFDDARLSFECALKREPLNRTVEAKLGLATVRAERPDRGLALFREGLAAAPHCAELHEGLIVSFVYLNRMEDAARAASRKLEAIPDVFPGDYLRAASLWAQLQQWSEAGRALEMGLRAYPQDAELQRAHNEVLQAAGTPGR